MTIYNLNESEAVAEATAQIENKCVHTKTCLEAQLAAVKNDWHCIFNIEAPCDEVQLAAVKKCMMAIMWIKTPCFQAKVKAALKSRNGYYLFQDEGMGYALQVASAMRGRNREAIFWERFDELAFSEALGVGPAEVAKQWMQDAANQKHGKPSCPSDKGGE